jgi:endonuclease YncB( thermonuclease family)
MVLLASAFLLTVTVADAASLYGKVVQVDEGDVITVHNLNRPIKIQLLGIDAPEKGQPYAEIARQHLSDFVLNKFVVVHYSGLGANNYIIGRVVLDEMDVCAQMIRDGAAWFDLKSRLSDAEREIYSLSEHAARKEQRGIWQDATPVAPWDFRRELAERRYHLPTSTPKQSLTTNALTSEDLLTAVGGGSGRVSSRTNGSSLGWRTLAPSDFNFSVLVPGNALESGVTLPGKIMGPSDINVSAGSDGNTSYVVLWAKGLHDGSSDAAVTQATIERFTELLNKGLNQQGVEVKVERERALKNGSFGGTQFKLLAGNAPGVIRVFTSHTKKERHFYMLIVGNGREEDTQVGEFLNSLNLSRK